MKRHFWLWKSGLTDLEMMNVKIGFIGAGKVGKALGLYFQNHQIPVAGYCSRTHRSAKAAAELTGTECFASIQELADVCSILFLTTSDQALADVDHQVSNLLRCHEIASGKVWLHVSGAHPSACLSGIQAAGCAVGSMHPLQSFGDPQESAKMLEKTHFSIEGMPQALQKMTVILTKTGGKYNKISTEQKALYHAGACILSNYLVTLLDSGMHFMEAAGMNRDTLFRAVFPLIEGTLKNVRQKGTVEALTGPIVRGDFNTVAVHWKAIREKLPGEAEFYREMALKTVAMVEGQKLTHKQAEQFRRQFKGCGDNGK